ncbi:hypothetical protein RB25_09955 [Herbaspirillum rubrisubalbicans]|uniref:Uncharacterized protein n=1 Tax=Herbaspirillum rubrisubalbicans TaxID=80842 RepID=A0ABX9BZZ5_9BURK|nr:hypothetical protein [Herbaspirillum rubrisubalbicans]RAM63555.1 hypothetical protein RB24_15880 [Herbaspirillum rubrisubalbicans]RAN48655.1 hypothetical protein RB25_09955 [Herbaspirillum rubrisubalbicans]
MHRLLRAGHEVQATGMPGMTLAQALAGQQAALERAMQAHRLGSVVGTAGIETAILPQERAHSQLVGT